MILYENTMCQYCQQPQEEFREWFPGSTVLRANYFASNINSSNVFSTISDRIIIQTKKYRSLALKTAGLPSTQQASSTVSGCNKEHSLFLAKQ